MAAAKLTILLPLKGRSLFTLRFLWHAHAAHMPYKFVIADGAVNERLAGFIAHSFPSLDIDYIRFPDDTDLERYYLKLSLALERVTTPYVKIADNDDFLVRSGLDVCVQFLEGHPDHVCAGGRIAGFSTRYGTIGPINRLTRHYSPRDATSDDRNTWTFYAVFRTDAYRQLWREILDINPSHLGLTERYLTMRTAQLGKTRLLPDCVSYLRQYWTSLQQHTDGRKGFADYLGSSTLSRDVDLIVRRLGEHARPVLTAWLHDLIANEYGLHAALRRLLPRRFKEWLKYRWRPLAWFERRRFAFPELPEIERVLTGPEFLGLFRRAIAKPIVGVGGLCADPQGQVIGDHYPQSPFVANAADRQFVHKVKGEKFGMTLTAALRDYPFSEIDGTQFVPEGLTDLQMAKRFDRLYVNEIFRVYH